MRGHPAHQGLALKIVYIDSTSGDLIPAYVYREGIHFSASCAAEDVRTYLRNFIETVSLSLEVSDLDVLQSIASHLSDGVNRYGRRQTSIVKMSGII